jgi:hypothetical protein
MSLFSDRERTIVEALRYDPVARPAFELLKGCLVWADERPDNITSEGYSIVCDLWAARSYLHRGEPIPARLRTVWERAQREGLNWIGLRRLELSVEDKEYYDASLRELNSADSY